MSRLTWKGPAVEKRVWRAVEDVNVNGGPNIRISYEIESYETDGTKLYTAEAKMGNEQLAIGDFYTLEEAKEWIEESVDEWDIK